MKKPLKINYKKLDIFEEYNTKDIKFPFIISIPHSGTIFPEEFLANIKVPLKDLHSNEDFYVDELIKPALELGIPTISMNISRSFVDVNRDKIEIDPSMYYDYPEEDNCNGSRRCRVGFGVIHRITADNKNIYDAPISYKEVQERIKNVYDPYHKKLQQIIDKTIRKFGFCFVLDCHSMPSKICSMETDDKPIDFCLGTMFEQSCPKEIHQFVKDILDRSDHKTLYDCPYSGAFITFNYCQPRKKVYTLQLEINRGTYMNEKTRKKNKEFQHISNILYDLIKRLGDFLVDFKK